MSRTETAAHTRLPLRVLLVEDDPEYVRIVDRALGSAGSTIQVDHVDTLGAALLAQDRDPHDVILLDLGLPDADPETTIRSAGRRLAQSAPVFVLTSRDDRSATRSALDAGVEDYFIKDRLDSQTLPLVLRSAVVRWRHAGASCMSEQLDPSGFRSELRRRIACLGSGESLVTRVFALDHFEALREQWGEPWARRMRKAVANALGALASEESVVAELGDGVFALFDGDDAVPVELINDAVGRTMARSPEVAEHGRRLLTVCEGMVRVPGDGTHPSSLIALALDRAREASCDSTSPLGRVRDERPVGSVESPPGRASAD